MLYPAWPRRSPLQAVTVYEAGSCLLLPHVPSVTAARTCTCEGPKEASLDGSTNEGVVTSMQGGPMASAEGRGPWLYIRRPSAQPVMWPLRDALLSAGKIHAL